MRHKEEARCRQQCSDTRWWNISEYHMWEKISIQIPSDIFKKYIYLLLLWLLFMIVTGLTCELPPHSLPFPEADWRLVSSSCVTGEAAHLQPIYLLMTALHHLHSLPASYEGEQHSVVKAPVVCLISVGSRIINCGNFSMKKNATKKRQHLQFKCFASPGCTVRVPVSTEHNDLICVCARICKHNRSLACQWVKTKRS